MVDTRAHINEDYKRSSTQRREEVLEPLRDKTLLDGLYQLCDGTEARQGELAEAPMSSNNDQTWSTRQAKLHTARQQLNEISVKNLLQRAQDVHGWYSCKLGSLVRESMGAVRVSVPDLP